MNLEWSKFSYFDTSADSLNVQNEFGSSIVKASDSGTVDTEFLVTFASEFIGLSPPKTENENKLLVNKVVIIVHSIHRGTLMRKQCKPNVKLSLLTDNGESLMQFYKHCPS